MRSSILVLVLLSAIAISEACASKGFFEGLARLRVQTLLTLYPNLAEEIRNGQLGPNSNFNNRNGFNNNNNNNNRNPFNGMSDGLMDNQNRNQGGLQNNQLPNQNNQGLPNGNNGNNGNNGANGLLNGNGGGSGGNFPNNPAGNLPNSNSNLLN